MIVDAHAHCADAAEFAARKNVLTVLCGTDPRDAERVIKYRSENTWISCALHPWHSDEFTVEDMLPYIEQSDILGEIGLDSVWTEVNMDVQRKAFVRQLEIAERLGKPVALHTKGMEEEIARTLEGYAVKKMVHWYSCTEHLERYLAQDCYFSVGPDYGENPAVQQVLERVPLNRLLTETDGMNAVSWALEREVNPAEVETVLRGELRAIARAKGVDEAAAERAVYENLCRLVGK